MKHLSDMYSIEQTGTDIVKGDEGMVDRMDELRESMAFRRRSNKNNPPEPHWYYLEGFAENISDPFEVREAKARSHFLANTPIVIHPGEAIVGQVDWNEPFVTHVSNTRICEDVVERIMKSALPRTEKDRVAAMLDIVRPCCFDIYGSGLLTKEEMLAHECALAPSTFFNGHMVPAFDYLLSKGLDGILDDIRRFRDRPCTNEEKNFYDAMEITVRGIIVWFGRFSDLADRLIEEKQQGFDMDQLSAIRDICGRLAHNSAETYPEALQMAWFFMALTDYDSFGRADQYLYPYFRRSREGGMSEAHAMLWTKYMLIKAEESSTILNMTMGGVLMDGSSAVNELTMMIIQAVRENGFCSPNLTLRLTAGSPVWLWNKAHQSLSTGQGLPALYNDDVIIPMLMKLGYPVEEARDYCLAGCSQVILPGRCNFACDVGCYNLLKALELAMRDGRDGFFYRQVGLHTGKPEELDTWEKLKTAFDTQMKYMVKLGTSINNKDILLRKREGACVRSLVNHDCIKRGRGYFHGGARFYAVQNEACGITNAADSLYALKKFVYEEKRMTLPALVDKLDRDWEGDEALRLMLMNKYDKFGNDADEVDGIRASISADWYREMQKYSGELGGVHWPGEVVFIYHEIYGARTAASPDGRRKGQPMASSAGASAGMDMHGPTALLNSMMKIPQRECHTCCILNIAFHKPLWAANKESFVDLFRTYFAGGGFQLQVNVTDRETLLKAKQNPEEYASLVVRVGGFSDYFCRLNPALQNEIIARTEF
jgi:pyruvate-formate lyase